MKPLSAALVFLLAVPASGQVIGEAASAASGSAAAGAVVTLVPGGVSAPALSPSSALGVLGFLSTPAAAPKPGALPAAALAPLRIMPIDAKTLPDAGKNFTPAQWETLVAGEKDEGVKAVLRSMPGNNPSDPRLTVKLHNGESVQGAFRGLAGGKMIFESGGKLVGLGQDAGNIAEVRRQVDINFDGATLRPGEVVVHDRPAVADPFKDLARYQGRVVDLDIRDLDDLKWSAQTVSGRLVKADGAQIVLEGPKGKTTLSREDHRVDKASLRVEHYSSRDKISTISDVAGKIPNGGPVEVVLAGGKIVKGRFFGLRKDAGGDYALIEVPSSGGTIFRGYRDFYDLRTPGFGKDALLPDAETVYAAPDK